MERKRSTLTAEVERMDLRPSAFAKEIGGERSPWESFREGTRVHLGKRAKGWKFLWNFNGCKYYSSRQELIDFIASGRVINEYGEEIYVGEFISMALGWEQPNGRCAESLGSQDTYVDGLRVFQYTDLN